MDHMCPECGALWPEGFSCERAFHALLAREWQDPELQAEHFFLVACYNLQHPSSFTDEALNNLQQGLFARLETGLSIRDLRKRAEEAFDGPNRVKKPEAERQVLLRRWTFTLVDVYAEGALEGAAKRVRDWADSIHRQMSKE